MRQLFIQFSLHLIILLSLVSCISYKTVQIKEIKSVKPLNNNISSGKLVVNLRVANPNNYSIKVKKYNLHAYLNKTDLGEIKVDEKIVLPGKSDQEYSLTFAPDAAKIMSAVPMLLFSDKSEASLRGSVTVKALLFSKKFEVDLKKNVSAKDFR